MNFAISNAFTKPLAPYYLDNLYKIYERSNNDISTLCDGVPRPIFQLAIYEQTNFQVPSMEPATNV